MDPVKAFIIIPIIAVIGIFIVGTMIEELFKIAGATILLFGAVGGIAFIANFYKR